MNNTEKTNTPLEIRFNFACIREKRGNLEAAVSMLKEIISQDEGFIPAYKKLGNIFLQHGRLNEARNVLETAVGLAPNDAEAHKELIDAILLKDGFQQAYEFYKLSRLDGKLLDIRTNDLLCCVAVRNEAWRLPWFVEYYRNKGVAKFFMVDNGSDDESVSWLLRQRDVYVWQSECSFNRANFGSVWFELLLRRYGVGRWCLIVDADEIFVYPDCENRSLVQLCRNLDRKNKKVMTALLLDMYSDKPVSATHYESGKDFLESCPYFDRQFYHRKYEFVGPFRNSTFYFGGVRQRVFGEDGDFLLSKVALVKYHENFILSGGQHWTNRPLDEISGETGCLLHFKFLSTFQEYVALEVGRKEHYHDAMQYGSYLKRLLSDNTLNLYDSRFSVKYETSEQLIRLGIMRRDGSSLPESQGLPINPMPEIAPVAMETRPFWSVMVTVYDRTAFLEETLRRVVAQFEDERVVQIDVLNDGADDGLQDKIRAIVESIGSGRIGFHAPAKHLGHPEIFNECIRRATGHWIHILHDDDWVVPGFYSALRKGISTAPNIGAAFCRFGYADAAGKVVRLSWLERETPGVIEDWLERIAVSCRLQTPAVVVRRSVYENLGGYSKGAGSGFDWEMWKRVAVHYPVWFEPKVLACFREHDDSVSSGLISSGRQVEDALRAIDMSYDYLPAEVRQHLSAKAYDAYALYALSRAKSQLTAGRYSAALANISAGLACSQSFPVREALIKLLRSANINDGSEP